MPKITELNAITTVANNDLLMVVHDPSGLPSTNKITVNNFISSVGTQLRGYTGSVGAASAIGYTGSIGVGYAGSSGPAGTSGYTGSAGAGFTGSAGTEGYTGSAGTGYTGSTGIGYTGSAGTSGGPAVPNVGLSDGYVLSSNSTYGLNWTPNPDVVKIAYVDQFGNTAYTATQYDSIILVDPTAVGNNVTISLPLANAIQGHRVTVKNINTGGPGPSSPYGYTVTVTTTNPGSNYVEHPVTGNFVTSYELKSRADGETWVHDGDIYRHVASEATAPIFYTNADTYAQLVVKNASTSNNASSDMVAYNDAGNEEAGTGPFIDMGINSSLYNDITYGNVWGPNDAYLYNTGGNLIIGPQTDNNIKFVAGNTNVENVLLTINTNAIHSNTSFIPTQNNIFSLGSANKQWKELWVSNNTIYIGGVPVTVNASGLLSVNGSISTGYTGSAGSSGTNGYTGSAGTNGNVGYTGSAGAAGYTGSSGLVGYAGSNGTAGYTGSEGAAGSPGSVGYTGSEGPTGFTGSQGDPLSSANFLFTSSNNSIELNGANTLYIVDNWSSGLELISNTSVQLTWAYSVDSVGYSGNTGYFYINGSGAYVDFYDGVTSKTWNFASNGDLVFPDNTSQNTAFTNSKTLTTISSAGPTTITNDVTFADPNAAGANVNLILPSSPISGKVYTVKNINAGGKVVYVQTDGTDSMENESGSIGSGVYATISTTGSRITWIYDAGSTTYRIID